MAFMLILLLRVFNDGDDYDIVVVVGKSWTEEVVDSSQDLVAADSSQNLVVVDSSQDLVVVDNSQDLMETVDDDDDGHHDDDEGDVKILRPCLFMW